MISIHNLVQKYNQPAPRYTSYPPVPYWDNQYDEGKWFKSICKQQQQSSIEVDVYIHIPFCEQLCYYCGCNRTITKNHDVENRLVDAILKEWSIYCDSLNATKIKVVKLHLGGGTPTFINHNNFARIFERVLQDKASGFVGSIEIDPRHYTQKQLEIFEAYGFKRFSLGIQDFDSNVQEAINRIQSVELVQKCVDALRAIGAESINFDLIYGLPKQSVESICGTINCLKELRPDSVALYAYAHLPSKIKNQRLINNSELPDPTTRAHLYLQAREQLVCAGYQAIGIDHFSRPDNYLALAHGNMKLRRSFMGYSDRMGDTLVGLGPTAISENQKYFVQNSKDINFYYRNIESGKLALSNGHARSELDLKIAKIIENLMCYGVILKSDLEIYTNRDEIYSAILDFIKEGILLENADCYRIKEDKVIFTRNVAILFDVKQGTHLKSAIMGSSI